MTRMTEEHTGGMIALIPRVEDAEQLRVSGGDRADEMHLTLVYLGDDVTDWSADARNHLTQAGVQAAQAVGSPVRARVMGHAVFNPDGHDGQDPCAVYLVGDSAMISPLRGILADAVSREQHSPFIAHVTAGYGVPLTRLKFVGDIVFDRLRVALAGQVYDFPLGEVDEKSLASDFLVHASGTGLLAHQVERKVMSADPRAARLREHWAHGPGRAKWSTFAELRRQLKKYVKNPHILDGLTANIYRLAKGRHPGSHGAGEKDMRTTLTEAEVKAALALADPDAEYDETALTDWLDDDGDEATEPDGEDDPDEAYEQALVDEVDWSIDGSGALVREDDDEAPIDADDVVQGPRSVVAAGPSLFDF
jgi:hypothetical protein